MIHHNPRPPLLLSLGLLAISGVGTMLEGLWSIAAFILGTAIMLALLLQSQARIQDNVKELEDDVRALEVDVRGVLRRERDDDAGGPPAAIPIRPRAGGPS